MIERPHPSEHTVRVCPSPNASVLAILTTKSVTVQAIDGKGTSSRTWKVAPRAYFATWSPDGKTLALIVDDKKHTIRLLRDAAEGDLSKPGRPAITIPVAASQHAPAVFAADGQTLYVGQPSGPDSLQIDLTGNFRCTALKSRVLGISQKMGLIEHFDHESGEGLKIGTESKIIFARWDSPDSPFDHKPFILDHRQPIVRDGRVAWIGSGRLYHATTLSSIETHQPAGGTTVRSFDCSSAGDLAWCDANHQIHLRQNGVTRITGGHRGRATDLVFSADGNYLAAVGFGATVILDQQGQCRRVLRGTVAVAPQGQGSRFWVLDGASMYGLDLAANPTTDAKSPHRRWEKKRILSGLSYAHGDSPRAPAFAGGTQLLCRFQAPAKPLEEVYDVITLGEKLIRPRRAIPPKKLSNLQPTCHAASPDGTTVALGLDQPWVIDMLPGRPLIFGALQLVDREGTIRLTKEFRHGVRALAYSPDGKRLLLATEDGTIRILEASACTELLKVSGPRLLSAWWTKEGRLLACTRDQFLELDPNSLKSLKRTALPKSLGVSPAKLGTQDPAFEFHAGAGVLAVTHGDRVSLFRVR